jgi:hypothetical protein
MIKLETARKLKEAGLSWEPKVGDLFYWESNNDGWKIDAFTIDDIEDNLEEVKDCLENEEWLPCPRLDQLLGEIEARGYWWELYKNPMQFPTGSYDIQISQGIDFKYHTPLATDSPEEAAAQALLWILEQEGKPSSGLVPIFIPNGHGTVGGGPLYICPKCSKVVYAPWDRDSKITDHCLSCGQELAWKQDFWDEVKRMEAKNDD